MIREFVDNLGGRKFVFAIILMLSLAGMIIAKVDLGMIKTFFNYAVTIFGLYVTGNVTQKFSQPSENKEPETVDGESQ